MPKGASYQRPPGIKGVPEGTKFTGSAAERHGITVTRTAKDGANGPRPKKRGP